MTFDAVMEDVARQLDAFVERALQAQEARIRRDLVETGPEDDTALDRLPDPDSPWRRVTVEEVMAMERERLAAWRVETLAAIRVKLAKSMCEDRT